MSAPPPTLQLLQRRTLRVLVVAQLLGALGLAAGGTAGALLAEHLTGSAAAAGLPLSLLVLGSGVAAVAVTRVMRDHGRRAGLTAAYLAGAAGAALAVAAAGWGSCCCSPPPPPCRAPVTWGSWVRCCCWGSAGTPG
jgi:MFS family permease